MFNPSISLLLCLFLFQLKLFISFLNWLCILLYVFVYFIFKLCVFLFLFSLLLRLLFYYYYYCYFILFGCHFSLWFSSVLLHCSLFKKRNRFEHSSNSTSTPAARVLVFWSNIYPRDTVCASCLCCERKRQREGKSEREKINLKHIRGNTSHANFPSWFYYLLLLCTFYLYLYFVFCICRLTDFDCNTHIHTL